jgi:diguanylate cyclase (GGDEF)-like protein
MAVVMVDLGESPTMPKDRQRALLVVAGLLACWALVVPVAMRPLGTSYPIFAIVIALSIAAIAVTAVLLWAQARVTRSVPLAVLALGYALTASVMLPYLLFYRGLWPELIRLISADPQTSGWFYVEWHALFIGSTIAYFLTRKRYADAPPLAARAFRAVQRRLWALGVAILVVTLPPLIWIDGLPALSVNGHVTRLLMAVVAVIALGAAASIGIAFSSNRFNTLLDLWLSVACFSMLADVVLALFSHQFAAGWYFSRLNILLAASAVLFVLLFQTANIYAQLAVTAERLRNESLTDALTGLANRRSFDQRFAELRRACARESRPLSLLMIDVDQFKVYNDAFGHQAGDECLHAVASMLQRNVGRATDVIARFGGEEIAVIMPEVDLAGAMVVAERMRATVEDAAIPQGPGSTYRVVTISIGVAATSDPGATTEQDLLSGADRALYRAKESGRNVVIEASA